VCSMSANNVHVYSSGRGWELRREGWQYPTSRHATRRSAIANARRMALEAGADVIVHDIDGRTVRQGVAAHEPSTPFPGGPSLPNCPGEGKPAALTEAAAASADARSG
jgi:hypothetical protein